MKTEIEKLYCTRRYWTRNSYDINVICLHINVTRIVMMSRNSYDINDRELISIMADDHYGVTNT